MRTGGNIQTSVRWHAPKGWRLLDMALMSNQPIPVKSQQVKVELLGTADAVLSIAMPTTDGAGNVSVADNAAALKVRVTDRFGNIAIIPL